LSLIRLIPRVVLTALLLLLHGYFGRALGVRPELLMRNVTNGIPRTATTIYTRAGRVFSHLNLNLLEKVTVPLPPDACLRGRGNKREIEGFRAPDLARNIAFKLMNPQLNNPTTPMQYKDDPELPGPFVCAGPEYSPADRQRRLAALERASQTIDLDIQQQIPGEAAGIDEGACRCECFFAALT
jgi:hypothetical protein